MVPGPRRGPSASGPRWERRSGGASEPSPLGGGEGYAARDDAPGLPKVPASERIDIDENGKITGLC